MWTVYKTTHFFQQTDNVGWGMDKNWYRISDVSGIITKVMHESESNLYKLLEKFKQNLGIRWYLEGTVNFVRYSTTERYVSKCKSLSVIDIWQNIYE